jgi:hypothetical protein
MLIGDFVTYEGRRHVALGFMPMSCLSKVELRNIATGETFWVEWPPAPNRDRGSRQIADGAEDASKTGPALSSQK